MRSLALVVTLVLADPAPAQFAGVLSAVGRAGSSAGRAGATASRGAPHFVPHGGISPGTTSDDTDWAGWALAAVCVGGVLLAICVSAGLNNREVATPAPAPATGFIRVTGLPPGEAPEDIRSGWVGVVLPLHPSAPRPRSAVGDGVLTGEAANLTHGYFVDAAQAVTALSLVRPDAAAWWRTNTPHLLVPGGCLVFPAEVCEVV